jgi:hypothetical protein
MAGFGPIGANLSISDLASCFFPNGVLASNKLDLTSRYSNGSVSLMWQVDNDANVLYYELQRGNDEEQFETISKVDSRNGANNQTYFYEDAQSGTGYKFYRVRETMKNGNIRYYSNVSKVSFHSKIDLVSKPRPNPFINSLDLNVQLTSTNAISVRLLDQSGRAVHKSIISGQKGSNNIHVDGLYSLKPGIYVMEVSAEEEVIREKLIKQ